MLREVVGLMPVEQHIALAQRMSEGTWILASSARKSLLTISCAVCHKRGGARLQNISAKKTPGCARALLSCIQVKPTSSPNLPLIRCLPSKATITCFHERVKPIGDKAQGYDAEQELTKWLTCEFSQCSIQSYSLFRIMLVRGHYQEDANDAEDHAQRSIPESNQIDHHLPHLAAPLI